MSPILLYLISLYPCNVFPNYTGPSSHLWFILPLTTLRVGYSSPLTYEHTIGMWEETRDSEGKQKERTCRGRNTNSPDYFYFEVWINRSCIIWIDNIFLIMIDSMAADLCETNSKLGTSCWLNLRANIRVAGISPIASGTLVALSCWEVCNLAKVLYPTH